MSNSKGLSNFISKEEMKELCVHEDGSCSICGKTPFEATGDETPQEEICQCDVPARQMPILP